MKTASKFLILYYDEAILGTFSYVAAKNGLNTRKRRRDPNVPVTSSGPAKILLPEDDVDLARKSLTAGGASFEVYTPCCTTVRDKTQIFNTVSDDDNLYVVAHGQFTNSTDDTPTGKVLIKTSYLEDKINAEGFTKLLVDTLGLPNKKIKLKLFICRSAGGRKQFKNSTEQQYNDIVKSSVAGQVASFLKKSHPKISVYGYVGACSIANLGKTAGMLAGNTNGDDANGFRQSMDEHMQRWQ